MPRAAAHSRGSATGGASGWRAVVTCALAALLAGGLILAFGVARAVGSTGITITSGGCSGGGFSFCYSPEAASASIGEPVTWTNQSGVAHTVTLCDTSTCSGFPGNTGSDTFDLVVGGPNGSTTSFTFSHAGTYYYYCKFHGYLAMNGRITVAAASPPPATPPPTTPPPATPLPSTQPPATQSATPRPLSPTSVPAPTPSAPTSASTASPSPSPASAVLLAPSSPPMPSSSSGRPTTGALGTSTRGRPGFPVLAVVLAALLAIGGGAGLVVIRLRRNHP